MPKKAISYDQREIESILGTSARNNHSISAPKVTLTFKPDFSRGALPGAITVEAHVVDQTMGDDDENK